MLRPISTVEPKDVATLLDSTYPFDGWHLLILLLSWDAEPMFARQRAFWRADTRPGVGLLLAAFVNLLRGSGACGPPFPLGRAVSSVVEHYLDTVGVTGSSPVPRTIPPFATDHATE